jgi:hypothetical protein
MVRAVLVVLVLLPLAVKQSLKLMNLFVKKEKEKKTFKYILTLCTSVLFSTVKNDILNKIHIILNKYYKKKMDS